VYISSAKCPLTLEDCTLNPNSTGVNVGVSAAATASRTLTLIDTTISAGGDGHGIYARDLAALSVTGGSIAAGDGRWSIWIVQQNAATLSSTLYQQFSASGATFTQGINIPDYWRNVLIDGCQITINRTAGNAVPGIHLGMDTTAATSPLGRTIVRDTLVSYTGEGRSHGILIGVNADSTRVENCEVRNADISIVTKAANATVTHTKCYGSRGIYLKGGRNGTYAHNTVVPVNGPGNTGAIHWVVDPDHGNQQPTDNVFIDNIVDSSAGGTGTYAYFCDGGFFRNHIDYSLINAHADRLAYVDGTAYTIAQFSNLKTKWTGTWTGGEIGRWANDAHSFIADPKLVSPSTGDFSLKVGSPAINAGYPRFTLPGGTTYGPTIGAWQPRWQKQNRQIMRGRLSD
jgi:hypothetical protein